MNSGVRRGPQLDTTLWVAVTTGLLADAYLPFALAGWYVRSPWGLMWPVGVASGLCAVVVLSAWGRVTWSLGTGLLAAIAALAGGVVVILNLLPPIARDEIIYHLALPKLYFQAGRMFELPFTNYSYFPMLIELLYMPLLGHVAEIAPKYLHLLFGLASAALVFGYLAGRVRSELAWFAAVLLFTTPTVLIGAASAYVDLGQLCYGTVALVGLLRWSETDRAGYLVTSALAAGCGACVKLNGLLLIACCALGVALIANRRGPAVALGLACGYGLVGLIPVLPWLVRNAVETGNPVFPFFMTLIGGRQVPDVAVVNALVRYRVLYGQSWLDIALIPLRVFVAGRAGDPSRFDGVFNPLYLLGFAMACRPGAARRDRLLAAFAAVFMLLTFFLQDLVARYVAIVLVPLVVLTAEGLERWWTDRPATRWALVGLAAGALLFNAAHVVAFWQHMDPFTYLSGRQTRAEYVTRFVPEYPMTAYANTHLSPNTVTYLAFLGSRAYYWERPFTYDNIGYSEGSRLRDAARRATDARDIARRLRAAGISHLAAADRLLARSMRDNLTDLEFARWHQFTAQHLQLLYAVNGFSLYAIEAGDAGRRGAP